MKKIVPILVIFLTVLLWGCGQKPVLAPVKPVMVPNPFDITAQKLAEEAQYKSSSYYLKKAIEIYQNQEQWDKVIQCHIKIANNYHQMGNDQKAMGHLNQALTLVLKHSGHEFTDLANQFKKLAHTHFSNKDYDKALELYEKALKLQLKVFSENHLQIAKIYNSIALVYWNQGDIRKAKGYYDKSLSIKLRGFYDFQMDLTKKYAYIDGGETHYTSFRQLRDQLEKSLKIYNETYGSFHPLMATLYEKIGILHSFEGSFERAMQYFQKSLNVRIETFGDESMAVASSYHNIGVCLRLQKEYLEAERFLEQSLQIKNVKYGENHPFVADSYYQLGKVHFFQNQFERALHFFQKSLIAMVPQFSDLRINSNPRLEKVFVKSELLKVLADKAETLNKQYLFDPKQTKALKISFDTYKLMSHLIDMIRREYRSADYKLVFGERSHEIYNKAIQVALTLYELTGEKIFKKEAFGFSEKSKAALLYESVIESNARKFAGIPLELLEEERKLKKELAFYGINLEKEYRKKSNMNLQKVTQLETDYFQKKNEYQKLIKYFEENYKKYFQLKYQHLPVEISDLQKRLDSNTALVEYFWGNKVIIVFVVTKESYQIFSQPVDSDFNRIVQSYYRSIKKIEEKAFLYLSRKLHQILIEPIIKWVIDKKKLIIIPHGDLYYVPFESLASEGSQESDFQYVDYLIRHYSISYHYSASLWFFKDLSVTPKRKKSFIGFAPVFNEKGNQGYILSSEKPVRSHQENYPDSRSSNLEGKKFPPLRASENEILDIIELFRKNRERAVGYFHKQATESNFKLSETKDYNYIHIATHSLSDKRNPKLSGLLFFHDKDKMISEDGILYSEETFNLDLDAELIVLSSCESGIGKLVKGEGMIALNRGFFYSGANHIVFSLWKVEDKATCRLMIELYRNILKNIPLSSALQQAKLTLIKDRFTAFPKYWSGFILVGR